jgi:cytochrome c oxidase subunit 2
LLAAVAVSTLVRVWSDQFGSASQTFELRCQQSGVECDEVMVVFESTIPAVFTAPLAAANTSVFRPATPGAESIRGLFLLVLAIAALILVIVEGALIYCVIRFRARRTPESEPPQIYGSGPIELAWTVGPLLIVFVLFLVVFRALMEIRPDGIPSNALQVTVVGHQWWWAYRYPAFGVVTANELHVPVSDPNHPRPVYLSLRSADVIHSYWVPRLGGKTDLIPGRTNHTTFTIEQPDVYLGRCSEYCGRQHANMMIRVIAEPEDAFRRWAAHQAEPAVNDESAQAEREAFLRLACVNCHAVRGTSAAGTVGPDLTHLMTRDTLAAGVLANTPENLAAWIRDPQAIKPGCKMPNLKLDDRAVSAITTYLQTLK